MGSPSTPDPADGEVRLGRAGSALLALIMTAIALLLAAVTVGAVAVVALGDQFGTRELASVAVVGALFPASARAAYVFWGRVFDKTIEPLVPWWISIGPAALALVAMAVWVAHGFRMPSPPGHESTRSGRGMGASILLVAAPFVLYRQQKKKRAPAGVEAVTATDTDSRR